MEATVITCDLCGKQRGETNHWFIAVWDPGAESDGIAFGPIGSVLHGRPVVAVQHLCGQECLHRRLSQWLESPQKGGTE